MTYVAQLLGSMAYSRADSYLHKTLSGELWEKYDAEVRQSDEVELTCIQVGVLGKSSSSSLDQQTAHGDALWLELPVQRIEGICFDAVCYSEFWDLQNT